MPRQGWECPRCLAVNGPLVRRCACKPGSLPVGHPLGHLSLACRVIVEVAAARWAVESVHLLGSSRSQPLATARRVAMYLMFVELGMTYSEIGRLFGRDHSTVMYACRACEEAAMTEIPEMHIEIRERIAAMHV